MSTYTDLVLATEPTFLQHLTMLDATSGAGEVDLKSGITWSWSGTAGRGYVLGRPGVVSGHPASIELNYDDSTQDGEIISVGSFNPAASSEWTINFWLDNIQSKAGDQVLVHLMDALNANQILIGIDTNSQLYVEYLADVRRTFTVLSPVPGVQRYMLSIARRVSGPWLDLTLNGVYLGSSVASVGADFVDFGIITLGNSQVSFGVPEAAGVINARGIISGFSFWTKVLSAPQLLAIYNAGRGLYTPYTETGSQTSPGPAPVVQSFSPTPPATVPTTQAITFDIIDAGPLTTSIWANYPSGGPSGSLEAVYVENVATSNFTVQTSTVGSLTTYTVTRIGGWPSSPFSLVVKAVDPDNTTQTTVGPYTITDLEYPPSMEPTFLA